MQSKKKMIVNTVFLVAIFALTIYGVFHGEDLGAMMVGKIVNENAGAARRVQRGEEKGYFAFGGSTVIVLAQKGSAVPEKRIWNYSRLGIETRVRQGETVGMAGRTG